MKYLKFHSFTSNITIIQRAYFLPAFYSITISWLGYFCYGPMTPVFILFSPKVCNIMEVVVFITIIRVLFLVMVLFLIAVHINTLKEFIFYFILDQSQKENIEKGFYQEPQNVESLIGKKTFVQNFVLYFLCTVFPYTLSVLLNNRRLMKTLNIFGLIVGAYFITFLPPLLCLKRKSIGKFSQCIQLGQIFLLTPALIYLAILDILN